MVFPPCWEFRPVFSGLQESDLGRVFSGVSTRASGNTATVVVACIVCQCDLRTYQTTRDDPMAFKTGKSTGSNGPETPEALFLDTRTRKVPGLLSHQADVLRKYAKDATKRSDVALQLPTGSGKTLVGLLIAEWRRRK